MAFTKMYILQSVMYKVHEITLVLYVCTYMYLFVFLHQMIKFAFLVLLLEIFVVLWLISCFF